MLTGSPDVTVNEPEALHAKYPLGSVVLVHDEGPTRIAPVYGSWKVIVPVGYVDLFVVSTMASIVAVEP